MVANYLEIEEPKELDRLNRELSAKLSSALKRIEKRKIGYPAGDFIGKVRFLSGVGQDVFWWENRLSDDKTIAINFFGHGSPGHNETLNIDVQFNLPIVKFSRKSGGAFLQHNRTREIVLAHRGIVTLGHGRIKKSALFSEMVATLREADTSGGNQKFLLIGELNSPTLINDISTFSYELRRTAKTLKSAVTPKQQALRHYFDEFSGKRVLKWKRKTIADCYHGTVVRTLRDELTGDSEVFKTQEIDLITLKDKKAFIFEVKTSADNQSIYTAIGQLTVHAPVIAKLVGSRSLERVIILPEVPNKHLHSTLTRDLGIRILTFTRSVQGLITINGLDQLK
ncbi:hypothetical protein C4544_03195 [candidate division WS5 bacterium]|uniref:Uncharacterized protein n=1 Tax=candidate division WS5 bacterium TaxID=2093353 RepID=A0A419DDX8_9BACT|nr:MAG: hypothetical protein C4544_03195 [candidate division WS5 bacterium]